MLTCEALKSRLLLKKKDILELASCDAWGTQGHKNPKPPQIIELQIIAERKTQFKKRRDTDLPVCEEGES